MKLLILHAERSEVDWCHALHCLQMRTEKISQAYAWRGNHPPRITHAGFYDSLRNLTSSQPKQASRIVKILGYDTEEQFDAFLRKALPHVKAIEQLAPALAGDGINTEYPWPAKNPTCAPAQYTFRQTHDLQRGVVRQLLKVIDRAVTMFDQYA